jgi:hypothetical protein
MMSVAVRVKVIIPKSGESANNSSGTNATDTEVMNTFANGSTFSAWDKQLQRVMATGTMLLAAACATAEARTSNPASSTVLETSTSSSNSVPSEQAQTDQLSPLIIKALAPDPIPVKGSDNKFHVAYELSIFNDSPRPATITKLETLASDHNGEVISTMSHDEITALALLTANYPASPTPVSEIPAGRTLILPLDDVYDLRHGVPASVTHRITATFGPIGPDQGELANIYPEKVVETGGSVTTSHDKPVIIGPPVTGDGWVAGNGLAARKLNLHRAGVVPVGGRLSGTERFAIDWIRVDPSAKPLTVCKGDPTKNESYLSFDQPLVAVADGTVVSVVSDQPNVPPGVLSRIPFAQLTGNRIILDIGNGIFALYAHVKNNGVAVKIGEKVNKGQVIGRLGNSGSTTEPHLHFQLMRGPLPLSFDNVPWEIDHFTLIGSVTRDGVVSDPAAGPRTNELPLADTVNNFVTPGR